MAERVVDLLEAVEVDQQHGDVLTVRARLQGCGDVLVQGLAVREARQRVVPRLVADLRDVRLQAARRAAEGGQEQDEEEEQRELQHPGHREQ